MWIIIILGYLFSVFMAWLYIKLSRSKGGIYSNLHTRPLDIFFTLMPIVNTCFLFIWIIDWPIKGVNVNMNKFFGIK